MAVGVLMATRKSGLFSETLLHQKVRQKGLDARDGALAGKICFGVLQNRALLDFYLGEAAHGPIEKLEPWVLDVLRVALYQMVFLDRVPVRAAVHEAVELTKGKNPRAAGLVNAVLRRISERLSNLPEPPGEGTGPYLAIKYSHPLWLVERFCERLGYGGAEALLGANNAETPLFAQVNTLQTNTPQVEAKLRDLGVEVLPHPWLPDCLVFTGAGGLEGLKPFADGDMYIQDPGARLAVTAAEPRPGMALLDACAAPGGKSFAAAIQMGDRGVILAGDIQEKKLKLIQEGAKRMGISIISTRQADAREADFGDEAPFDIVLVDAPCSGFGVIRKKPDIRYKTQAEIAPLPDIQLAILRGAARWVKLGGTLLYSTCTLLPEENEGVVGAFLEENAAFTPEGFPLPGEMGQAGEGGITLYPHVHGTDGFFLSKLRRVD